MSPASFLERHQKGVPIVSLTAYDYPTARILDQCGVDIVLVGDSLGTNVLGYPSVESVTLNDMLHHVRAVKRGVKNAFLLADMPFQTYESPEMSVKTAQVLIEAGADGVKFEGPLPKVAEALASADVFVCGHLGYTPQTQRKPGVKGKTATYAAALVKQAIELEQAGASLVVLELIPTEVAEAITGILSIPTIGIGAGSKTSGQILVLNDLVGFTERGFRHSARLAECGKEIAGAVSQYVKSVQGTEFPTHENAIGLQAEELRQFESFLKGLYG